VDKASADDMFDVEIDTKIAASEVRTDAKIAASEVQTDAKIAASEVRTDAKADAKIAASEERTDAKIAASAALEKKKNKEIPSVILKRAAAATSAEAGEKRRKFQGQSVNKLELAMIRSLPLSLLSGLAARYPNMHLGRSGGKSPNTSFLWGVPEFAYAKTRMRSDSFIMYNLVTPEIERRAAARDLVEHSVTATLATLTQLKERTDRDPEAKAAMGDIDALESSITSARDANSSVETFDDFLMTQCQALNAPPPDAPCFLDYSSQDLEGLKAWPTRNEQTGALEASQSTEWLNELEELTSTIAQCRPKCALPPKGGMAHERPPELGQGGGPSRRQTLTGQHTVADPHRTAALEGWYDSFPARGRAFTKLVSHATSNGDYLEVTPEIGLKSVAYKIVRLPLLDAAEADVLRRQLETAVIAGLRRHHQGAGNNANDPGGTIGAMPASHHKRWRGSVYITFAYRVRINV
jgi:hypothetical protein